MMQRPFIRTIICITALSGILLSLRGCNDVSSVKAPPPQAEPGPFTILTSSPLPNGTVTVPYNIALAASGGTSPYTWSLASNSPPFPAGLTLNANGIVSGTPTAAGGPVNVVIQVQDAGAAQGNQQTLTKTLAITIGLTPTGLTILTSSLPSGSVNQPYATALGGNGGTTPYTWGLNAASPPLPNGLTLSPTTGAIVGVPTVTSNLTHIFTLTDATSLTVEQSLQLTISAPPPPSINAFALPDGTVNQPYPNTQLTATGGTVPYTWSVTPALPNGLSLNSSTGVISGTPLSGTNGVTTHTFTVTDSTSPIHQTNSSAPTSLTINAASAPLAITTTSLPDGTEGQAYSTTLQRSAGVAPFTWSVTPTLPSGLSLNALTGAITGTPAKGTAKNYNLTFTVQDSSSPTQSASKTLMLKIEK